MSRLASSLRTQPSATLQALQNMHQLHQVVLPFAPPVVSDDMELVGQVDVDLFLDLITQLEKRVQQPQRQAAATPAATPPPQQVLQHNFNYQHQHQEVTELPLQAVQAMQLLQHAAQNHPQPDIAQITQQQQQPTAGNQVSEVSREVTTHVSSAMPVLVPSAVGRPPTITTGAPLTYVYGCSRPDFFRP